MPLANLQQLLSQPHYPGLLDRDAAILREWLAVHGAEIDSIEFNVRLGPGVDLGPGAESQRQSLATKLSQFRADAIARAGGAIWILEVKQTLNGGALGQLLTYRFWFERQFPLEPRPTLIAIGRRQITGLYLVAFALSIALELFEG